MLVVTLSVASTPAQSTATGVAGWNSGVSSTLYGSAEEACRAQWVWAQMDHFDGRFIGALDSGTWWLKNCSWTSFQYLCGAELQAQGKGGVCGTVLPGNVTLSCQPGYTLVIGNFCRPSPPPERPQSCYNNGGNSNPSTPHPVLLASGAKIRSATDYASADGRFQIARNYRSFPAGSNTSLRQLPRGLANGWQFNFGMELQLGSFSGSPSSPTGNVTLIAPDGSAYDYTLNSSGQFLPRSASGWTSTDYRVEFVGTLPSSLSTIANSQTEWRVTGPDDRVWTLKTFTRVNDNQFYYGRPTAIVERDGYAWTLNYAADTSLTSIVDTFGRTATFTWNYFYVTFLTGVSGSAPAPEAVSTVTFPDGTSAQYTYDPPATVTPPSTTRIERLVGVTLRDSSLVPADGTTYQYENTDFPFALTGITDHRNVRVATYQYDDVGRVTLTKGADEQDQYAIAYGASATQLTRTVTNPLGRETVYAFDKIGGNSADIRLAAIDGQASTNCPAAAKAVSYGSNGFVSSTTDEEGRVTTFMRDARGRPTEIDLAHGTAAEQDTTVTWDATYNAPATIVRPGLTTTRTYNSSGRLTTLTETDTTTHSLPYSTNGQTRTWAFTYTTGGLVATIDGPLAGTGDTVSYTYDANGYVATYTDETGNVTTVNSVNGRGQPTKITDANGLITDITYDAVGRMLTTNADPTGVAAVTLLDYDAGGNVTKVTQPDGSYLSFAYDNNNRVSSVANTNGDTAAYTYDAAGNVTSQELSNSFPELFFRWQKTFDELGRVIKVTGAGPASWAYGYDKVGNLTSVTDPNGNSAGFAYDALSRLVSFTDERSSVTASTYGNTGQPETTTDPRSVVTTYVRNGWGEAIEEKSNDLGIVVYERNASGNITKRTDARGVISNYGYDNASRIASISYPAEPASNVNYAYDSVAGGNHGKGRLTGVTDAAGTVAYSYDLLGRVTQEARVIAGQTYVIGYEMNASGNVVAMTYPSGRRITFDRDADGKINVVKQTPLGGAPAYLTFYVGRTPFGPRLGITYANDTREARRYDQDGRLTNLELLIDSTTTNIIDWNYHYDDKRNLTAINDFQNAANNETYTYTANGFLASASGSWGALTYQTDGVGNITQRMVTVGGVTSVDSYSLQAGSNRLTGIVTDSTPSRSFQSDLAGNTTQDVTVLPALTKDFIWNNAGQLKEAKVGGVSKGTYVYDYLSRLVSRTLLPSSTIHTVHDLDGNVIAEYSSTGTLLREYVWLEERPLAVIDSTTLPAATYWVQTDQLERPVMMTDINSAIVWRASYLPYGEVRSISGPTSLELRFPGQWFQLETGLSYNWHRHYDPSTGRYLQPDPLGMPDGPSRWAYAKNSPLMSVDPNGLQQVLPTPFPVPPGPFSPRPLPLRDLQWWCHDNPKLCGCIPGLQGLIGSPWSDLMNEQADPPPEVGPAPNPEDLQGLTPDEIDAKMRGLGWTAEPTSNGQGTRYSNPVKKGEQVRIHPAGTPGTSTPDEHDKPYGVISKNGQKIRFYLQ